jgi:hypothetical protein
MGMGMGGAITAVAATTTVGTAVAATTMVGDIIAIGGEQRARERLYYLAASFIETLLAQWGYAMTARQRMNTPRRKLRSRRQLRRLRSRSGRAMR